MESTIKLFLKKKLNQIFSVIAIVNNLLVNKRKFMTNHPLKVGLARRYFCNISKPDTTPYSYEIGFTSYKRFPFVPFFFALTYFTWSI